MLEFADGQREDFVSDSVEVFKKLVSVIRLEVFKEVLNVNFNVSLFVTVSVLLFFNVFHAGILLALLLPVEFLVDVAGSGCNRQIQVS